MKTQTVAAGQNKTIVLTLTPLDREVEFSVEKKAELTLIVEVLSPGVFDSSVTVRLTGRGSKATILGFVIGVRDNQVRLHTLQKHEAPETTSNLLVKSVLRGASTCTIDGGIRVEKLAQKTDAYQRNENLLLSESAHAESKPSLEILANDVRCTHGATVGPVSEEELWYLATRGIPAPAAQSLIVEGFLKKATDLIAEESVRNLVWQSVVAAL